MHEHEPTTAMLLPPRQPKISNTGISRFMLIMWGQIKNHGKQKLHNSRLLSSTKGEENRIALYINRVKSKIQEIEECPYIDFLIRLHTNKIKATK